MFIGVCIEPFQDNVWDTITFVDLFGVIPGSIGRKWRREEKPYSSFLQLENVVLLLPELRINDTVESFYMSVNGSEI